MSKFMTVWLFSALSSPSPLIRFLNLTRITEFTSFLGMIYYPGTVAIKVYVHTALLVGIYINFVRFRR